MTSETFSYNGAGLLGSNLEITTIGSGWSCTPTYPQNFRKCQFCGKWHDTDVLCPSVQEVEYFPDGTVKRVVMRK